MTNQVKAKLFMFRRWWRILTGKSVAAVRQDVGKTYSKTNIRGYYNDLTGKVSCCTLLDEGGIPLTQTAENKFVHFPIAIFQYGLGCYDLFLIKGDIKMLDKVRLLAEWAVGNQRGDGSWDSFSPIGSRMYTVSSMCQGEGASLLFRAYVALHDEKYRNAAFRAVDFMLRPLNEGGTAIYEGDDMFLEEYPQQPRRSVLNGWIFSLFGLYDASLEEPERYRKSFMCGMDSICKSLTEYDNGFWSLYDLAGHISSPAYHDVHIALLQSLYELTGRGEIESVIIRYKKYQANNINKLLAVAVKFIQKLTEHTDAVVVQ